MLSRKGAHFQKTKLENSKEFGKLPCHTTGLNCPIHGYDSHVHRWGGRSVVSKVFPRREGSCVSQGICPNL